MLFRYLLVLLVVLSLPVYAQSVAEMLTKLDSADQTTRLTAVQYFTHLREKDTVEPLITALKLEESPTLRAQIATALGYQRDKRATPALLETLRTTEVTCVRRAAVEALRAITGQNFDEDADAWEAWRAAHLQL